MTIPEHLITPRDWQAEALAFAARELGTPEGRRAMIETNRYGALADQVESLRRERDAALANIERMKARKDRHDALLPDGADPLDEIERLRAALERAEALYHHRPTGGKA